MTPFYTIHTAIHAARNEDDLSQIRARYDAEFSAVHASRPKGAPADKSPGVLYLAALRDAKIRAFAKGRDVERRKVAA